MSSFSLVKQWISIVIHPSEMEKLQQTIVEKLYHQVCEKCMDGVGYVKDVENIIKIHDDHVSSRTGSATINVLCTLNVIQVKEGDINEAVVTTLIHDKGLYAEAHPLTFFAKWHPDMSSLYEGNVCKIRVLRYRLDGDKIRCIGEYISQDDTIESSVKKRSRKNTGDDDNVEDGDGDAGEDDGDENAGDDDNVEEEDGNDDADDENASDPGDDDAGDGDENASDPEENGDEDGDDDDNVEEDEE